MADPLEQYRAKRDFDRTGEPDGTVPSAPDGAVVQTPGSDLRFVVQKHAARALHYDLRLEVDGVMASWAVPKGPSYDPAVRRLAIHVEDHPLDYRSFEGTIAGGEYGGGAVIVWDEGTYCNDSELDGHPIDLRAAMAKGHVRFELSGSKLHGGWHLIRTDGRHDRGREQWLLTKRRDATADPGLDVTTSEPRSILSGRTVEEVAASAAAAGDAAGWMRPCEPEPIGAADAARLAATGDWLLWWWPPGERVLAVKVDEGVELWSGNGAARTDRYPGVAAAVASLPAASASLDLVVGEAPGGAVAHPLDLLRLLGRSTTAHPTSERLALLRRLCSAGDLRTPAPPATLREAGGSGSDAVLMRRATAPYRSGPSADWRVVEVRP